MTNKTLTLDCNVEYKNKPLDIAGIRQIKLGYRPSGVNVWISTENTGDNLYKLENKGDGWINLPEVLENCYITTQGTNISEKLIIYYSGEYSDFYSTGNAVTGRINELETLQNISDDVLYKINSTKNIYDTTKIKFLKWVNGAFDIEFNIGDNKSQIWITKLADLSQITFDYLKCYKITIEGHVDLGGKANEYEGSNTFYWKKQSLHLDIIDLKAVDFDNKFTLLESTAYPNIDNIYQANERNAEIETKQNHFCFWGGRYSYYYENGTNTRFANGDGIAFNPNFKVEYVGFGFLFLQMQDLILSFKNWINVSSNANYSYSFHFSLAIKIEVLDNVPNAPVINSNPYINNSI